MPVRALSYRGPMEQRQVSPLDNQREERRFRVQILIRVSTVIDAFDAELVDLSANGLRISGAPIPRRARVIVEYEGSCVCGIVRWTSERGLVGIKLDTPLAEGPLAAIWRRYNTNVASFGATRAPRRVEFGRRAS